VEPGKAALLDVPWTEPASNAERVAFDVELLVDGSAKVAMTEQPVGAVAVATRHDLVGARASLREQVERSLLRRFGPCRISQVNASNGDDLSTPVRLEVQFQADEMARRRGSDLVLRTGFDSSWLQELVASPDRKSSLLLGAPRSQHD